MTQKLAHDIPQAYPWNVRARELSVYASVNGV